MQTIPLQPIPNQTLQVQLSDQACTISIVQTSYGLFATVQVNGELIISNVICLNRVRIVRSEYLEFVGDLLFVDMQGNGNPVYTGFGDSSARFQFVYLTAAEVEALT